MAYGLIIPTSAGQIDIGSLRSLRKVFETHCSTETGSILTTGLNKTNVLPAVEVFDGLPYPFLYFVGDRIYWRSSVYGTQGSSNFDLYLMRFV